MLKSSILPMRLQFFAEPAEPTNNPEPKEPTVDIAELQKRLANVTKQRDGLLAKQKAIPTPSSAAPQPSSAASVVPSAASSANDDVLKEMQAQIKALQEQNNAQKALLDQNKQRSSFIAQSEKDGIQLNEQDLNLIGNASDQDATYEYIKSLKNTNNVRKFAPRATTFNRQKDNVGASLAKVDSSAKGLGALLQSQEGLN